MNEKQREMARHALGLPNSKHISYRNHYCIGPAPSMDSHEQWLDMVAKGWAIRRTVRDSASAWLKEFHGTLAAPSPAETSQTSLRAAGEGLKDALMGFAYWASHDSDCPADQDFNEKCLCGLKGVKETAKTAVDTWRAVPAETSQASAMRATAAEAALERDRTRVAECVTAAKRALDGYDWLLTSRGPYEWDDDRWHKEFENASKSIRTAIEPMVAIAADWSNCPKTQEEIQSARAALAGPGDAKN